MSFAKNLKRLWKDTLAKEISKKRHNRVLMSDSEIITIMILFHKSHYWDLKIFYINYIQQHCKQDFSNTVSYNRFVEFQQKALLHMVIFLQLCCLGKYTGISFIDSTSIRICHKKREYSHKTFKRVATKGKISVGWFFGFKLHLVINDKGKLIQFLITQAHVDDREPFKNKKFHEKILGRLFADKGYIFKDLIWKVIHRPYSLDDRQ